MIPSNLNSVKKFTHHDSHSLKAGAASGLLTGPGSS